MYAFILFAVATPIVNSIFAQDLKNSSIPDSVKSAL
jgi:hypothetical protein